MDSNKIRNEIRFSINGKLYKVKDEYPIETTLVKYIRDVLGLTGTKSFCKEGGCGVCTVFGRKFIQATNEFIEISLNSCLFPLYSCDGWEFTTVEGVGNKLDGINQIQKRLADANGSQCGYCSPGFVMNMYSLLKSNSRPSELQIENSFDGNICRCTGYRAILDSMKSFAKDPIDIEDISRVKCMKMISDCSELIHIRRLNKDWYQPLTLNQLNQIVKDNSHKNFKFIAANTSKGVYKTTDESIESFINIQSVHELNQIKVDQNQIEIGSSITIKKLIDVFKKVAKENSSGYNHFEALVEHLEKIGTNHLRNMATWAGNLWLKKINNEFYSDILIILELAQAKLILFDTYENKQSDTVDISEFLNGSYKNKSLIIQKMVLPAVDSSNIFIRTYKCMKRPQNCAAYISAGFCINKAQKKSIIVINGINGAFFHAKTTENYLNGNDFSNESVLKESIKVLSKEIRNSGLFDANNSPLLAAPKYRFNLIMGFYYKFILSCFDRNQIKIDDSIKSAIGSLIDVRKSKVSRAEHDFMENELVFPVNKCMPKLNSYSQTCGETKYVNDTKVFNQLQGAFILTKYANATIEDINVEKAMKLDGIVRILFAKDIPGKNNFMHPPYGEEKVFCDGNVDYAGQPVGLVVAESYEIACEAAKLVDIKYKDIKKPILTIDEAIKQKSYHMKRPDFKLGDVQTAIQNAPNKLSGEINLDGSQIHFYLEGICAVCEPTEDGFKVECTTQWVESVIQAIRNVLGTKNTSSIDVSMKQVGGAFGGKISRPNLVAAAAALACHHLNKPVKINLDLNANMSIFGGRPIWRANYNVGFDNDGKLLGIEYDWYSDTGFSDNGSLCFILHNFLDGPYRCDNYLIKTNLLKTNKAACCEMRSPDMLPALSLNEFVIEHIANYLNKESLLVRQVNFYKQNDIALSNRVLTDYNMPEILKEFLRTSKYYDRKKEIEEFNGKNRWKKRGISLTLLKYPITHKLGYYNILVSIHRLDGSVSISGGGVEIGQGIHTKMAQCCAYELGIPIEKITVKPINTHVNPNAMFTAASATTDLCCKGIYECARILNDTLKPIKDKMSPNYTWEQLIEAAYDSHCQLSALYYIGPEKLINSYSTYFTYGCACSEVIVDVLTGEIEIAKTEMTYDCGQSLNPMIDMGQAEGAFMTGIGYWLYEKSYYDEETGQSLSNGTWNYKPPLALNFPTEFKLTLLKNRKNEDGIYGSKTAAEPPIGLAISAFLAIKNAINSTKSDVNLQIPATPENIQMAFELNEDYFELN